MSASLNALMKPPSPARRWVKSWTARPEAASVTFLLLLGLVLSALTAGFATVANLSAVLQQIAVVGIVALAVNHVVLAGEIDVSTGSLTALCAFTYAKMGSVVPGAAICLLTAMGVGGAVGALNGWLSTFGRIPSLIVTVGMLFIVRGALLLAEGSHVVNVSPGLRSFGTGSTFRVDHSILILILVAALGVGIGTQTTYGRNLFAIGGNERAARVVGLPVERARLLSFVSAGLSCALAGAVLAGQIGQLQATVASGFELKVIAAVVLGGTRITGGRGSNLGPLIGAVLVGVILNALTLHRVSGDYELLVLGSLILAAVTFEGIRQRLGSPDA